MKVPLKSVAFGIQGTNTASLVKEIFRRCGKVSLLITKKLYNVEHDQPLNMWLLHVIEVIGDALVILTWHFPYKTNFIFAFHSILLLILLINQIHVEEFTINFVNILKQNSIKYIKLKWRDNAFVLIFLLSSLLQILETEVWNWKLLYNSQYKLTGTFAPSIYISFFIIYRSWSPWSMYVSIKVSVSRQSCTTFCRKWTVASSWFRISDGSSPWLTWITKIQYLRMKLGDHYPMIIEFYPIYTMLPCSNVINVYLFR